MGFTASARVIRSFVGFLIHEINIIFETFTVFRHYTSYSHSKEHNSKFFGDRYTILEGSLNKRVVLHPLVPSAAVRTSAFMRYRHFLNGTSKNIYEWYEVTKMMISHDCGSV